MNQEGNFGRARVLQHLVRDMSTKTLVRLLLSKLYDEAKNSLNESILGL